MQSRNDNPLVVIAVGGNSLIAEQWVNFDYEVSCIGARNVGGDIAIYPLSHNVHEAGILRTSRSPVDAPDLAASSISISYLGDEVPPGEEVWLHIWFWDGASWQPQSGE